MGISNQSQGLKPGVCTSTTRPSAPYEGMMIYETDTDLTYVWNGSSWQQVSGGTAVGNSGLVYVAGGTFSGINAAAPLDVNGVFSSLYTNYRIYIRASCTVANAVGVAMRMRTASTIQSSALYNFGWGGHYIGSGPSYNWAGYAVANPFSPEQSFFLGGAPGNGYSSTIQFDLYSPNVARQTRFTGQAYTDYTGTYYTTSLSGSGELSDSSSYTGFRLWSYAGTIAGEYVIYGYRI